MTEQICWGTVEKLLPIVQELKCPPKSLMILERVPDASCLCRTGKGNLSTKIRQG